MHSGKPHAEKSAVIYLHKMTTNVCSLVRKLPDSQEAITGNKSNIVVATETCINSEINDTIFNISDYIFFQYVRSGSHIGGLVALILLERLKP